MSKTELGSSYIQLTDALRDHIRSTLDFALSRFGDRVQGIAIRLVDTRGPNGASTKRCRVIVSLAPADDSIVVEAIDPDAYAAVTEAAIRLERRVAHAVTPPPTPPALPRRGRRRRARTNRARALLRRVGGLIG